MSYGLKYFFTDKQIVGTTTTTYTFELLYEGHTGSATEFIGKNIERSYDQLNFRKFTHIQKSQCKGTIAVRNQTERDAVEEVAESKFKDFKIQLKRNSTIIWSGWLMPDLISIGEQNFGNMETTFTAKDIELSGDFTFSLSTNKAITTIAQILNTTGLGLDIKTSSKWIASDQSDTSDDVYNQIYHNEQRFRQFAETSGNVDRPLTNNTVLEYMLKTYGAVLRQADGDWQIVQLSALNAPNAVPVTTYNSSGVKQGSARVSNDLRETIASNQNLKILGNSVVNNYYAGLEKVTSTFQHDSDVQSIKIPRSLRFTSDQTFSQYFAGNGTTTLRLSFNLAIATNVNSNIVDTFAGMNVKIQAGTKYLTSTMAWSASDSSIPLDVTGPITIDSDGNDVYQNNGISIISELIPDDADGVLSVLFDFPDSLVGVNDVQYVDLGNVQFDIGYIADTENSDSIDFELRQTLSFNEVYEYGKFHFGDGPSAGSLSALKLGTAFSDGFTSTWKLTSDSSTMTHHELLMREIMDARRGQRRNIRGSFYGEYEPNKIIVYDGKNLAFLGGSWNTNSYEWNINLIELNFVTAGSDTLVSYTNATGGGSTSSTGGGSSSNSTSATNANFLQVSNNLSDLNNASTARTNLGVAIGSNVQAHDAELDTLSGLSSGQASDLVAITEAEYTQIQNIDSVTISNTQFGYLGALNQNLTTTSDVQFDDITASGTIRTNELDAQSDLLWNTSTEVWNTSDFYITGAINLAGSLYITDELDVSESVSVGTTLDVTGNTTLGGTLDVTGNTTIGGSLTLSGSADFNSTMNLQGTLTTQSDLQDDGFVATFGGSGYQIKANGDAEFGNLLVRGALTVFEFIAKQISTIGGTEVLTIATGVVESSATNQITLQMKDGSNATSFKSNDLIRVQVVDINQNFENDGATPAQIVRSYKGQITNISGNVITTTDVDGTASSLQKGDLIVAIGNTSDTDRQSIMYRNVDRKTDKLITRVQTGINTHDGFLSVDKTRVAFGDLNGYSGLSSETFGFFAGDNSNEHALITSSGIFFKNNTTVLAQLSSDTFKVGDSTNFLSFNGSSFDIATTSFSLNTTNLDISSTNQNIVIGTGTSLITLGKLANDVQGLKFDNDSISGQNFWRLGQGNVQFKVGDGTNFLSFDENAGSFDIQTRIFTLDTTASGSGIKIDSSNQQVQLKDANRVRTQIDVNNGSPTITENSAPLNQAHGSTVITQGPSNAFESNEFQVTVGDSALVETSAQYINLGTGNSTGVGSYTVTILGGATTGNATNTVATFFSNELTSTGGSATTKFSFHSYQYSFFKLKIEVSSEATGNNAQFQLNSNLSVKSFQSQTRVSLDGVFVNSSDTQFAKLTRSANELSGIIRLTNLPTVKPAQTGILYKESDGTLKVS
tara:strand:- start:349 stop:4554 length:4206 start_codon:yes stop_codon:yes gene_type:complete